MPEVIVFTSGKGGVGKSNLCLNSALQLTALQYRTCLFDGDLGLANVNILLGIDQEYTLDDVVFNHKSIDDILVRTGYGFDIIPGSSGVEQIANLSADQLQALITALTQVETYDYFLIDTASGISRSVIAFCMAARQTVIVITREATSLTDAYALLKILSVKGYQGSVRVLINDCESIPQAKSTYLRYKKVVDKHLDVGISPAGIVLHDDHFERAVVQQKPLLELYPESIGAQCIRAFVANLVGADGPAAGGEGVAEFWQRYLEQVTGRSTDSSGEHREAGRADEDSGADPTASEAELRMGQDHAAFAPPMLPPLPDTEHVFGITSSAAGGYCAPAFIGAIFKRLNQGEISSGEMRRLILVDPALMVQALKFMQFSRAAPQGHIQRLEQITSLLNDEDLQPLLVQAALKSVGAGEAEVAEAAWKRWTQSYQCAILARELGQVVSYPFPDEAYLGGLLLDIGQPPVTGKEIQTTWADHAEAGAAALHSLGLNPMICDAVRFHHHPASQVRTAFNLVRIVYAAHILIQRTDSEEGDDFFQELVDIDHQQALDLLDKSIEITRRTTDWLGLPGPGHSNESDGRNGALAGYLLDNLLTRSYMSPLSQPSLSDWARQFHRSCALLAGIRQVVCLVADDEEARLSAVGFDGCFCGDHLENISFEVSNSSSLVSKAYTSGSVLVCDLDQEASLNLGDRQLGKLLGGRTMVLVPLRSGGKTMGLMVCGGAGGPTTVPERQLDTLLTLGSRAAESLHTTRAGTA